MRRAAAPSARTSAATNAPADTRSPNNPVMPHNGQLVTGTPSSPSPSPVIRTDDMAVAGGDSAECSTGSRSVFDRLGNRPAGGTLLQSASVSETSAAPNDNNHAAAVTEDEDGEMTGSTSDEDQSQGTRNTTRSRILSLRTVVGSGSVSSRTAARDHRRHSPIIYDHPPQDQPESRNGSSLLRTQPMGRSGSRSARHPNYIQYEKDRIIEAEASSMRLETRRRRSSNSSVHQYERQRSASLTPPHLRDSNGLKYDRHGNLRRSAAVAAPSSSSPHSHAHLHYSNNSSIINNSSRVYGTRHRSPPSESLQRSYASSPSSSKFEKYRQYFDEFRMRRSDRPIRGEESATANSESHMSSYRSDASASRGLSLAEPEFGNRKRILSGSSRASYKQNDVEEDESGSDFAKKYSKSMTERKVKEESERVSDVLTMASTKVEPEQEVEEGEDFSDWSAAEAEDDDEDLDSISSTDEMLAHIFTTNHQTCPETGAGDVIKDRNDVVGNLNHGKGSSACTSSTDLTEAWKRLVSTPAPADSSSNNRRTGTWQRGEAGAAFVLQSSGFSSKLAGRELVHKLNDFIEAHCSAGSDGKHPQTPAAYDMSNEISKAHS